MRLLVHPDEVDYIDPRVPLCRRQRRVSEHLLDGPQIGPLAKKMGGEAVAERVGRDARRPRGELAARQQTPDGARWVDDKDKATELMQQIANVVKEQAGVELAL